MNQFPVEILVCIFEQACFDDKRTARSISLASKLLANIVDPFRFEAVSLYGPSQICGFASLLKRSPEHSGRIKHLFLSGITLKEAGELREVRVSALRELAIRRGLADKPQAVEQQPGFTLATKELERRVRRNVHCSSGNTPVDEMYQIIRDVAQSLETLFITSIQIGGDYFSFFPCSLPNLTTLSATSGNYTPTITHVLPKLKSIHTNCYLETWEEEERPVLYFRTGAPALEELRLTDIPEYHDDSFLEHLVQHTNCVEEGREDGLVFPDTMQRVIVQQGPPVYEYGCCAVCACAPYEDFATELSSAAASMAELQHERCGFPVVILEPLDVPYCYKHERGGLGYFFEDAWSDWMVLMSRTRDGC